MAGVSAATHLTPTLLATWLTDMEVRRHPQLPRQKKQGASGQFPAAWHRTAARGLTPRPGLHPEERESRPSPWSQVCSQHQVPESQRATDTSSV